MAVIKTFTLKPTELAYVEKRAAQDKGSDFYANMLAGYTEHKSVTEKAYDAIKRDMKEDANRPKFKGVRVKNRMVRDGKVVCRYDRNLATRLFGEVAVCDEADCETKAREEEAAAA